MIVFAAVFLFTACSVKNKSADSIPTLTVSEFILQAEQLENTTVSVVGQVDHLCMGTKAKIHFVCPGHPDESIKIFADDNLQEFSDTLRGMVIKATGIVEVSTKIDHEYLDKWEADLETSEGHHHLDEEEGKALHDDTEIEEPETHHHGNQIALITKYRKLVDASGKGYINLYRVLVSEISPADVPVK